MGGTHFLQTGYLLLNRNAPSITFMCLLDEFIITDFAKRYETLRFAKRHFVFLFCRKTHLFLDSVKRSTLRYLFNRSNIAYTL